VKCLGWLYRRLHRHRWKFYGSGDIRSCRCGEVCYYISNTWGGTLDADWGGFWLTEAGFLEAVKSGGIYGRGKTLKELLDTGELK